MAGVTIRPATADDLPAIRRIYAHHVLNGLASFEETAPSEAEMLARWRDVLGRGLPWLVAVDGAAVVGYAYASPYRARSAYRYALENSVYVDRERVGGGIGAALLQTLIAQCEAGPWRQMIAVIGDSANLASIRLHERAGFGRVGMLTAVGFKFGRWVDSVIMQRRLGAGEQALPDAPPERAADTRAQ